MAPETAILPTGWQDRLVEVRTEDTGGVSGWCLEVHDLASSKLAAGRDHDLAFVRSLLKQALVDREVLIDRLSLRTLDEARLNACKDRLSRLP